MYQVFSYLNSGSRGLSLFLGTMTLGLASAVVFTGRSVDGVANWVLQMFGISFLVLLSGLVVIVCCCWVRMLEYKYSESSRKLWMEVGQHAANGTATLALTYTLLGISLGISTLADQELNTNTVQKIIGGLTEHFSLAFMTTVVGLPVSAVLRALISITEAKLEADGAQNSLKEIYAEGVKQ